MKQNFFHECKTLDEVKALYRKLAKEHHPDKGGDLATMQKINKDYAFACGKLVQGENLSAEDQESTLRDMEGYKQAIDAIINLDGITIEVVGFWIWVTGDTKRHRVALHTARYFWASKKLAWYWRPESFKSRNKSKMSLDEIRNKYGSKPIRSNARVYTTIGD